MKLYCGESNNLIMWVGLLNSEILGDDYKPATVDEAQKVIRDHSIIFTYCDGEIFLDDESGDELLFYLSELKGATKVFNDFENGKI